MGSLMPWQTHEDQRSTFRSQLPVSTCGFQGSNSVVSFGGKHLYLMRWHVISKSLLCDMIPEKFLLRIKGKGEKPLRTNMKTVSEKPCLVGERF